jgi:very-short-patch-repair endonuclease
VATRYTVAPAAGFLFTRRRIPSELIREREGLRFTDPALTAIDLANFHCADSIDIALRTRSATLAGMHEALRLTRKRRGNFERLRLLLDSRENPWSAAERLSHRLLRRARIMGWEGNWPIVIEGDQYFIDIAFKELKLAIEIDGRLHETDEDLFESDRWRQNALVSAGWRVLRFTWAMLRDHPEAFVAAVRAEIRRDQGFSRAAR